MFKECPFTTNSDAINFVAALIEFEREEFLLKYLGIPYSKKTIKKFNSLPNTIKLKCKLFTGFLCDSSYSNDPKFKARYLQILRDHGLGFPKFEKKGIMISKLCIKL